MSVVKVDSIEDCVDKLKMFLPQYLSKFSLNITGGRAIKCLNPAHDDNNPSMSSFTAKEGHEILKCQSCSASYDIINAVHILEHKPISGPAFIQDTLPYLCEMFDVHMPERSLSELDIYKMNMYQAYKAASDYISSQKFQPKHVEHLNFRGWTNEEFLRHYRVGCCPDYNNFRTHMKNLGYSPSFIDEIGLGDQYLFSPRSLLFTYSDEYNRPIGFMARNLDYDGVKENGRFVLGPKYIYTSTKDAKVSISDSKSRLYLFGTAKDKTTPLYMFEGQPDALTAHLHGLKNSVAVSGVEVTEGHLNLCRIHGCYDVVICLDHDKAGQAKAKQILDHVLKNVHDIKIRFLFLPDKQIGVENGKPVYQKVDPDIYIRENGARAFSSLAKVDPFTWRLQMFYEQEDVDNETICAAMIPIISSDPSPIKRDSMVRELSEYTGISDKVIRDEIEARKSREGLKIQRAKQAVIDSLIGSLQNISESPEIAISTALDQLSMVTKEHNSSVFDPTSMMSKLLNIKQYQENEEMHKTVNFGENHNTYGVATSGDLRGKMILTGGSPNSGKTSMFCGLYLNLLENNPDTVCIFLTLDDGSKELISRILTYDIAARLNNTNNELFDLLTINKIAQPFLFGDCFEYDALMAEREISYKKIISYIKNERMIVLDTDDGRSLDFVQSAIKTYTERYPDKHVFFFLDNLHLLTCASKEEGRHKYAFLSRELKDTVKRYAATLISTVEYTKLQPGVKPCNSNIAESGALEYDANMIMHLWNEVHSLKDKATMYFFDSDDNKCPIIEAYIEKNKISGTKGAVYYKFYPDKAFYEEISLQDFRNMMDTNKARLIDQYNSSQPGAFQED